MQQQIACVECLLLKTIAVAWNQKPVANLVTQQIDRTKGREFPAQLWICRVNAAGKNKPDSIVSWRLLVIA